MERYISVTCINVFLIFRAVENRDRAMGIGLLSFLLALLGKSGFICDLISGMFLVIPWYFG